MFRFTIRDVMLFTVVVALGVGWWIDHARAASRHDDLVAHTERLRILVHDARNAYLTCRSTLQQSLQFRGRPGAFTYSLPLEPNWELADKPLPDL